MILMVARCLHEILSLLLAIRLSTIHRQVASCGLLHLVFKGVHTYNAVLLLLNLLSFLVHSGFWKLVEVVIRVELPPPFFRDKEPRVPYFLLVYYETLPCHYDKQNS